jgi:hypothetical protein
MRSHVRRRFWIEVGLAALSGTLAVVTLLWEDWIEIVFRIDPDRHGGSVERLIVLGLGAVSLAFAVLGRLEWRRSRIAASEA